MNILHFEKVVCGYSDDSMILNGITFEMLEGSFFGIIGPNGSGKTTLLRTATRILRPKSGVVEFNGEDIYKKALSEIAKVIAVVPQSAPSGFTFNVLDVVLMGRYPHKKRLERESSLDIEIARNSLKLTDCLDLIDRDFDELSAGERQRVIIARALAQEPQLLILDEPTSHLDIGHEMQIFDLIKKLNIEKNLSIVAILHDLNLASQFCDKLLLIDKGRVIKFGSPEEVLDYRIIEKIYKTPVVVEKNKITGNIYVNLVSKFNLERRGN